MDEELTPAEVSKRRITTQLKNAVKALQSAHVRDQTSNVIYRSQICFTFVQSSHIVLSLVKS